MAHTLYFLDRAQNTIWNTTDHYNDTHVMGIDLGSSTYAFDLDKNDVYNIDALQEGNFVVFKDYKDVTWCFTILEVQNFQNSYTIHCENLGLSLLNKVADKWPANGSKSFADYFNLLLSNTGWVIGVNEIADLKRTIEYESRETALKRLLSLLDNFDAEIDFQVEYKLGKIVRKVANIYKSRGVDRTAVQLVYNENLNGITKTSDMYDFCTALAGVSDGNGPVDKDGNAADLYLGDKDRTYVDPVTKYTFVSKKGDKFIRCQESNDIFNPSGDYVEAWYESQAKTADALFTETCLQLSKRVQPKVNYELDINDFDPSLNLGDTIKIVDHEYRPALYLSARLLELHISYTDESKNTALFGNFKVLTSNIELKVYQLQEKINAIQLQSGDTYFPSVAYANGINGEDFTTDVSLPRTHMAIIYQLNNPIVSQNPDDYTGKWKKIQGSNGTPGADGKTYYTWIRYADNVSGGGMSASPAGKSYIGIAYNKAVETPSTTPADYTWALMKGQDGADGKDGIAGKDGVGVKTTAITYAQSTSGTTPPSAGWATQVPTLIKGQYLWTRTIWTYTDNSTETGYTVSYNAKDGNNGTDGIAGKDGVGISNTKIEYVGSTSGTVKPTTGWSTTIPTVAEGSFLWTRTTWTYTDNTSEMGYSVAKMGAKGADGKDGIAGKDGVGIKTTTITYAQSTSGTTAPTTGWSAQVPTLVKGQYLWTRTVWAYTDASTETGYTVSYNAKDGNNGTDGIAGKDGVGIASTKIEYVGSTSGTTPPSTGWATTIPTVAAGNYLWTRTTWTYTDNTTEKGYSAAKMGSTGAAGANGQTSYTHYAWADNPTGTVGFSLTQSSGKKYMGVYTDFTPTASTDPTKYKWIDLANSIDFGVRNLLLNSSFRKNGDQWSISTALNGTFNGEYMLINKDITATTRITINQNVLNRINKGETYTLSGKYYIESVSGANSQSSTIFLRTADTSSLDTPIHNIDITKTGQWVEFSATGAIRSGTLTNGAVTLALSGDLIIKMRIKEFKLERGSKMTDWTPAPEDTDSSILALNNALANAKYPIVSTTQPANGIEGQQWWKVDANGNVIGFYIYTSGVWEPSKIDQSALTVVSLNAVNITGAEITGTTIRSSTMEITGSFVDQGATVDYTTKIDGPITQTWKYRGVDQHGVLEINPVRMISQSWTSADSSVPAWSWEVGGGGFFMQQGGGTGNSVDRAGMTHSGITVYSKKYGATYGAVNLDYQDLLNIDYTNIPASNFSPGFYEPYGTSGSNAPQCARFGRTVQLRGAIRPLVDRAPGIENDDMCTLPRWAWPAANVNILCQASGSNMYLLTVTNAGKLLFGRHRGDVSGNFDYKTCSKGAWLNIAVLYAAGDLG